MYVFKTRVENPARRNPHALLLTSIPLQTGRPFILITREIGLLSSLSSLYLSIIE